MKNIIDKLNEEGSFKHNIIIASVLIPIIIFAVIMFIKSTILLNHVSCFFFTPPLRHPTTIPILKPPPWFQNDTDSNANQDSLKNWQFQTVDSAYTECNSDNSDHHPEPLNPYTAEISYKVDSKNYCPHPDEPGVFMHHPFGQN